MLKLIPLYLSYSGKAAILLGGSLFGAGLAFALQVALGRNLGPEEYGLFSSALAQCVLLSQVAGMGLHVFWLSVYGREGKLAYRWMPGSLKLLAISFSVATSAALVISIWNPGSSEENKTLLWMAPSIAGFAAVELAAAKLQLQERYSSISAWQITHHAMRLALVLIAVSIDRGSLLTQVCAIYSIVSILLCCHAYRNIREMEDPRFEVAGHPPPHSAQPVQPKVFEVLSKSWPFGADTFLYLVYFQCGNILLAYLSNSESAGIFFSAFSIMNAVYLIPTVFYTKFLLAKLHRWANHDRARLLIAFKIGSLSMLLVGCGCALLILLFSDAIVTKIYGSQFASATNVLIVLASCAPVRFVSTSFGSILTTETLIRWRVMIKGLCAIACIALNIALIPSHGATGAAWATLFTEVILMVSFGALLFSRRKIIFCHDQRLHNQ